MRLWFLVLGFHLSLSFIFCSETQITLGHQGRPSFQEARNCSTRRDLPHLPEQDAGDGTAQLPLLSPQLRPCTLPLLGKAHLCLHLSPETSSESTFKTKLKCFFGLSPMIFQLPMALHFLPALPGGLNIDPGDVASCLPSGP